MRRRRHRTRRLELRAYTARDWPRWRDANLARLPAETRWDTPPLSPDCVIRPTFDEMRARHSAGARQDRHYVYGVFRARGDVLLGCVDLFVICREDRQVANLGYLIDRRFRGQGYGVEATRGALEVGFSQLGFQRIEASIDPDNEASDAVARAAGMRSEGLKRGYLFEDGAWLDQLVYVANPWDLGLEPRRPSL